MVKTEIEIERDFYTLLTGSELGRALRGSIYRSEMRPADSKTEDLVVKFLAGVDGQVQSGVVVLDLYVPDIIRADGRSVADKARIGELQRLINGFIDDTDGEYWIEADATPTTIKDEEIGQHFIYARLKFKRITI